MNPPYVRVFLQYYIPTMLIIIIMLGRISLLKAGLFIVNEFSNYVLRRVGAVREKIKTKIDEINAQQLVFFTHFDNIADLNKVLQYIQENEHTNRLKIVTVIQSPDEVPSHFEDNVAFLDKAYPDIDIEFVKIEGDFGPALIRDLSDKWGIPINLMFIGSPGDHFMYGLGDLGGLRLII